MCVCFADNRVFGVWNFYARFGGIVAFGLKFFAQVTAAIIEVLSVEFDHESALQSERLGPETSVVMARKSLCGRFVFSTV